ncbi:MAG: hypothetical protein H7Z42_08305, partial [Roseiflexaceae bacterium]|nr:hypothetical protein [Roseiflexaceae bacterium]
NELRGDELAAIRDTLLAPIDLGRVSRKLFKEEVIVQLFKPKNLRADYDFQTAAKADDIVEELWEQVRGNWARIDYMAQLFAVSLRQYSRQDDRSVWIITQKVIDQVLLKLKGDVKSATGSPNGEAQNDEA